VKFLARRKFLTHVAQLKAPDLLEVMSRANYIPAAASFQLISLVLVYMAGMAFLVLKYPIAGPFLVIHVYMAAVSVILSLLMNAASARLPDFRIKVLTLLNLASLLWAAVSGLFYFGGMAFPIYSLNMAMGFVGSLVTCIASLSYSVRHFS
jgi:hypothetical protein